jgi:hypothetical protein
VNQPEKAGYQDVAEFLKRSPLRSGERLVRNLPHRAADGNFAEPEMVDYAEPVLVVYGREETVERLWVDQQRTARDKRFMPAASEAACVSDHGRIRIFIDLKPDDWIFIEQRRSGTKLGHAQLTDIIVEKEHTRPSAGAADYQAKVPLPADIEGPGRNEALRQVSR